jgi:hypothetical protein
VEAEEEAEDGVEEVNVAEDLPNDGWRGRKWSREDHSMPQSSMMIQWSNFRIKQEERGGGLAQYNFIVTTRRGTKKMNSVTVRGIWKEKYSRCRVANEQEQESRS